MIEITLIAINVCVSAYLVWVSHKILRSYRIQMSYYLERASDMEKKLNTLAQVLKIFEDETQILKKRNEQQNIRNRFVR